MDAVSYTDEIPDYLPLNPFQELANNDAELLGLLRDRITYVGPMSFVHDVLNMYYLMIPEHD